MFSLIFVLPPLYQYYSGLVQQTFQIVASHRSHELTLSVSPAELFISAFCTDIRRLHIPVWPQLYRTKCNILTFFISYTPKARINEGKKSGRAN